MGIRAKISLVFLLFLALFFVISLSERDPEIGVCKHQCEQQQGVDQREKQQCKQRCERYKQEKEGRRRGGGGDGGYGGYSIVDLSEEEGDPREMISECHRRCQGSRGEQDHPECFQKCMEKYRREQEKGRRHGGGGSSGDNREDEEEKRSRSESESDNPYVFEDRHFMTKLKTEHGNVRVLQKFTDRSELLRGIENYRVVILEAEPQTFIVPNHWDADALLFVANGRGTISLIFPEKRESFNIKHGDILKVPAGITAYLINRDNNEKLILAKLLRPVSVPGEFQQFFGPGGETPESSFYRAFSTEILEAAFNTRRDKLEQLFGQQKQGIIVKASEEQIKSMSRHEEGGIWPFGGESKGVFNLFEKRPSIQNDYGRLHEVDSSEYRELEDINVAVSFANITKGSMAGPFYNSKGTKIVLVVKGEGHFEMACPHLAEETGGGRGGRKSQSGGAPVYQKVASRLTRGVVFVVPPGHPLVTVASNNQNLELVCFLVNADQNQRFSLAGRKNVVARWEETAQELAFGSPARAVREVFEKQTEELFFKGPRQQGRAFA